MPREDEKNMLKEAMRAIGYSGVMEQGEIARLCKAAAMDMEAHGVVLPGTVAFSYTEEAVVDPDTGETEIDWNTGEPIYCEKVTDESTLEDELCMRAIITYAKAHFGNPPNYQNLKEAYEAQLTSLMYTDGYTDFGQNDGSEG